ncbi:MAG: hypothetical protein KF686_03565 [Ramlibacter sp.]|nr:hypothetical protein [Ramlibacter sp.]
MKAPVALTLAAGAIAALTVAVFDAHGADAPALIEPRPWYQPSEIGMPLRSWHGHHNKGPDAWNNDTHGLYALWPVGSAGGIDFKAMAMVIKLSNRRDGVAAGLIAERGPLFAGLLWVRGYEDAFYDWTYSPGAVRECTTTCVWRTDTKRNLLAPTVGVRVDLPQRWRARLAYQPRRMHEFPANWVDRPAAKKDYSVLLLVGREWK